MSNLRLHIGGEGSQQLRPHPDLRRLGRVTNTETSGTARARVLRTTEMKSTARATAVTTAIKAASREFVLGLKLFVDWKLVGHTFGVPVNELFWPCCKGPL